MYQITPYNAAKNNNKIQRKPYRISGIPDIHKWLSGAPTYYSREKIWQLLTWKTQQVISDSTIDTVVQDTDSEILDL